MVGSAADADVEIGLDLAAEDVGIGSLGGQDQVDAEGPSLSGDHGQAAFDFQAVMEDFEKNIAILRKNFYKEEYQK